jgi:hypothetical protein
MPGVKIKLSKLSPELSTRLGMRHPPFVPEHPPGTYVELEVNETYWVYAVQVSA